jgi:hypothetical protein
MTIVIIISIENILKDGTRSLGPAILSIYDDDDDSVIFYLDNNCDM